MIMAAFFSLPSSAQLRVFQNGNVCVKGTNTTSNIGLSIGNINYDSNYNVYTSSMNPATGSFNIALEGRAQPSTAQSTGRAIGVRGIAGNCTDGYNYGVLGALKGTHNGAAILGTTDNELGLNVNGVYAGYFVGDVCVDGTTRTFLTNAYDKHLDNSTTLSSALTIINTLQALQGLDIRVNEPADSLLLLNNTGQNIGSDTTETNNRTNPIHYALNPTSISTSYPGLIRTDSEGNQYVSYTELIPVLVAAIKELYALNSSAMGNSFSLDDQETDGIAHQMRNIPATKECRLYQNTPNPFNTNTMIKYSIPSDVADAWIYIFDMQGKMLRQTRLDKSSDRVVINGGELQPGMYFYSLIVNGSEVDTKRMILSK